MREYYGLAEHYIEVDLAEVRPGLYRWSYIVDDRLAKTSDGVQEIQAARADALASARLDLQRNSGSVVTFGPNPAGHRGAAGPGALQPPVVAPASR